MQSVSRAHKTDSEFEKLCGYVRAREIDGWVFVSGTTGFDYSTMQIAESVEDQTVQTIRNIESALNAFELSLQDVVQCNWIITDRGDFEIVGGILKNSLADAAPVMMTLVAGLVDPRMKFEMQVIARRRRLEAT